MYQKRINEYGITVGSLPRGQRNKITDVEGVDKVELVYRNSRTEEVFLPYYRFYVALPEEQVGDGLITYGAYYVPAVQEDYLSNMPNIVFD